MQIPFQINWGSFRGRRQEKWGSFRGRFGDHFRVGDHFAVGIISGAVHIRFFRLWSAVRRLIYHFQFSVSLTQIKKFM